MKTADELGPSKGMWRKCNAAGTGPVSLMCFPANFHFSGTQGWSFVEGHSQLTRVFKICHVEKCRTQCNKSR